MTDNLPARSLAEISDQAGLGKAAAAILSSVEKLLGAAFRPFQIRREGRATADAEAYRIVTLAEANVRAGAVAAEGDADLAERARARVVSEIVREQRNIESIVGEALTLPPPNGGDDIDRPKIEDDWMSLFLNTCKRFGDQEIQALFSRILAFQANHGGMSPMLVESMKYLDHEMSDFLQRSSKTMLKLHHTPAYFFPGQMKLLRKLKQANFLFMDNATDITINLDPFIVTVSDVDGDLTFLELTYIGEELYDAIEGRGSVSSVISRTPPPSVLDGVERDRAIGGLRELVNRQAKFGGLITINVIGRNIAGAELSNLTSFKFLVRQGESEGIDTCERTEQQTVASLRKHLDSQAIKLLEDVYGAILDAANSNGIHVLKTARTSKFPRKAKLKPN
jgi:hypothetical protein